MKIPNYVYTLDDYPNLRDEDKGKVIPIRFGHLFLCECACVDMLTRTFRAAYHSIFAFVTCYVEQQDPPLWKPVPFLTQDPATATFTLAETDWDGSSAVAVDLIGAVDGTGKPIICAADVVEVLLTLYGGIPQANIDATTFAASKAALLTGHDQFGNPQYRAEIALDIRESIEITDIFRRINDLVGSMLYSDHSGKFRFIVFEPVAYDEATMIFTDNEIFKFEAEADAREWVSKAIAKYQEKGAQESWQVRVYEDVRIQFRHGGTAPKTRELELPVWKAADALWVAQRIVAMEGEPLRIYKVDLSHRAWDLVPGDTVVLNSEKMGINFIFNVIEVKRKMPSLRVSVVLSNFYGLGGAPTGGGGGGGGSGGQFAIGYWVADSTVFPPDLGGGSTTDWDDAWSDEEVQYAWQSLGYWCDDNGYADPTDPRSFKAGAWV